MPRDEWKRHLRRGVAKLQKNIRADLRLVSCGLSRAAGDYVLWLDCRRIGALNRTGGPGEDIAPMWRGRAVLPWTPASCPDDPVCRRGLFIALAQAFADIACRSEAGLGLWRDGGGRVRARRAESRSDRVSCPDGG